jgi:hypothetical protein
MADGKSLATLIFITIAIAGGITFFSFSKPNTQSTSFQQRRGEIMDAANKQLAEEYGYSTNPSQNAGKRTKRKTENKNKSKRAKK